MFFRGFVLISVFWILLVKLGVRGGKEKTDHLHLHLQNEEGGLQGRRWRRLENAVGRCCTIYSGKSFWPFGPWQPSTAEKAQFSMPKAFKPFCWAPTLEEVSQFSSSLEGNYWLQHLSHPPLVPSTPQQVRPSILPIPHFGLEVLEKREGSPIFWCKKNGTQHRCSAKLLESLWHRQLGLFGY